MSAVQLGEEGPKSAAAAGGYPPVAAAPAYNSPPPPAYPVVNGIATWKTA